MIFDLGANVGQFARDLLVRGYEHPILSVEPLEEAHRRLLEASRTHENWRVFRRCAVGDAPGAMTLHVAANSQSSSLLPMTAEHERGAPHALYVGQETVEVVTTDQLVAEVAPDARRIALKLDVQGYEWHVLRGGAKTLPRVMLIFIEMSLQPAYHGESDFIDMFQKICGLGFECYALHPAYTSPVDHRVMQVDALFARP